MMRNLEIERVVLAAMSVGIARRSVDVMNSYAQVHFYNFQPNITPSNCVSVGDRLCRDVQERAAFGKSLNQFGQMQKFIGESYAQYMAGKSYLYVIQTQSVTRCVSF